ncbi:MAG: hypothetical protein AB7S26_08425 [Sandaracinaceae bacterium]
MLEDADYAAALLQERFPHLAALARDDERIAHELGELLLFAPALTRAPRQPVELAGELRWNDGTRAPAQVCERSDSGVQLLVGADQELSLSRLLEAELVVSEPACGEDVVVRVQLVRVIDRSDEGMLLGFRICAREPRVRKQAIAPAEAWGR